MTLMIRYVAKSDVGMIREGNEDSAYAGPKLLAVADGMGGHAAGELASSVAIEELVLTEDRGKAKDPLKSLNSAIVAAHKRISSLVKEDPSREGMGTTVTALLWTGERFGLAHIGDSRGYRMRDGVLEQITDDHTFVQSLVDEGRITKEQARVHPARSMILKALQGEATPQADLEMVDARDGDRFLLCSDGLTDYVSTGPIEEVLTDKSDLAEAASTIVQLALRAGAPDNVTVIVADVIDTDTPPGPDDTAEAYLVGAASDDPPPPPPAARLRTGGVRTLAADTSGHAQANGSEDTAIGVAVVDRVEETDAPDADVDIEPVASDDAEEERYAPRPPRRLRWLRWLAALVVLVGVAWGAMVLANDWIRSQYFVGEQGGDVAIFRGISQNIGPLSLYEYIGKPKELPVGALPPVYRDRVADTIAADSLNDAERIVSDLLAEACDAQPPPATVLDGTDPDIEEDPGLEEPALDPTEPVGEPENTIDPENGEPGTETEPDAERDESDAASTAGVVLASNVLASNVPPDTQLDEPEEQPQTSGYPGLVCSEDQ